MAQFFDNIFSKRIKWHSVPFSFPPIKFIYRGLFLLIICTLSTTTKGQQQDPAIKTCLSQLDTTKTDSNRIQLLLKLGDLYSESTASDQRALKSYLQALAIAVRAKLRDQENQSLLHIAIEYSKRNDYKNCRRNAAQAINYYADRHDWTEALAALGYLRLNFRKSSDNHIELLHEIIWCCQQEQAIYLKLGDKQKAILSLKDEADANLNLGKLSLAENQLLNVVKQLKAIHYPNLYDTYYLLASVNDLKGNLNKELYYTLETVKENQASKDTSYLGLFYYKLARVYENLAMYDNSIVYYKKILAGPSAKDYHKRYITLYHICQALIKQNKAREALLFLKKNELKIPPEASSEKYIQYNCLAICYVALHKNDLAENYFLKMINAENFDKFSVGDKYGSRFIDDIHVAEFYVSMGKYEKADKYIKMALEIPDFNVSALRHSDFQLLQFRVDSGLGRYVPAIKHYQLHKQLQDSVFNVQEANQVADIQTKYETEAKDKNIVILTKESQLQKASLKEAAASRKVILGGTVMLALMLALGFNRYQLKQKSNKQLKKQQTIIHNKNSALEQLVTDKDRLLEDKEWLLKEIHHRVKNNLQIVISLLNTQSVYIENTEALDAIRESQHRMQSISLIHQKLYQSDNLAKIEMDEYIAELVDYLDDSFSIGINIEVVQEIEPIALDVEQAVPIGLILNEAVTNAIKYAFSDHSPGTIKISLEEIPYKGLSLTIRDNGRGLPDAFDITTSTSLGMSLITGLVRQMHGKLSIYNDEGVVLSIFIPIQGKPDQHLRSLS
ncbi:tetratricopeptide repeat-containing sensor histidine kinase [Mucilaginibacter kameinonensis]|uniref:tetratricopeptide repeat-containing sensor histidine kinase n=1 Tax=Mucilaginibacter kameinonensis TaxID=452286 RepID=UPI0013CE8669|nr:sensor histidine kinase [Mucilaginibacter kameinonensis]